MANETSGRVTACYSRVSTDNQATGLDSQNRALRAYCTQSGIKNYVIYEDEGISGVKDSRPALNKLMQDVEDGKIERVVVYSFSRYARSVSHLLRALEIFKNKGVAFVSLTEQIDTNSALGLAVFVIIGAVSQLERDLIRERVTNGLKAARERGVRIGRKKTRPSQLIRRLRKSGMTYREISKVANISQGAVAAEMRAWAHEKKLGVEVPLDDDLPHEESLVGLAEQSQAKPVTPAVLEKPDEPGPVSIVRS